MIQGITQITYCTDGTPENWAQARQFYADWGLSQLPSGADELLFETLSGARVRIVPPDHASLADCPAMESGATLREVVWGVKPETALADMPAACLDPHGLRQRFVRNTPRAVTVQGSQSNPYGLPPQRVDTPSPVYDRGPL